MESVLFRKQMWLTNLFVNRHDDDIWIIPLVENISRSYFEFFGGRQDESCCSHGPRCFSPSASR